MLGNSGFSIQLGHLTFFCMIYIISYCLLVTGHITWIVCHTYTISALKMGFDSMFGMFWLLARILACAPI